jgi:hypothetical protein
MPVVSAGNLQDYISDASCCCTDVQFVTAVYGNRFLMRHCAARQHSQLNVAALWSVGQPTQYECGMTALDGCALPFGFDVANSVSLRRLQLQPVGFGSSSHACRRVHGCTWAQPARLAHMQGATQHAVFKMRVLRGLQYQLTFYQLYLLR